MLTLYAENPNTIYQAGAGVALEELEGLLAANEGLNEGIRDCIPC
jgi:hypothetical protein